MNGRDVKNCANFINKLPLIGCAVCMKLDTSSEIIMNNLQHLNAKIMMMKAG